MSLRILGRTSVLAIILAAPFAVSPASADAPANVYHMPPSPIPAMIDAEPTPAVTLSHDRKQIAVFSRESLPSIEPPPQPILRLGGFRISPRTNGPAEIRLNWLTSLTFEDIDTGKTRVVALP